MKHIYSFVKPSLSLTLVKIVDADDFRLLGFPLDFENVASELGSGDSSLEVFDKNPEVALKSTSLFLKFNARFQNETG